MNRIAKRANNKVLYLVPAAIAAISVSVAIIAPEIANAATPKLPAVTPTQLLTWVQQDKPVPLSGTVRGTTSFPIPSVSALSGSNPASALSGSFSESANIWSNANGSLRIQQTGNSSEKDLYVNDGVAWLWNSKTQTATKETLPAPQTTTQMKSQSPLTPAQVANELITMLGQYSTIGVSGNSVVAGRPVYTLSIVPNASDSLIGSIAISIDSQTHVPDQVQIFPRGSASPAASLGFDTLSFATPNQSIFNFTPPVGSKVVIPSSGSTSTNSTQSATSSSSPSGNTKVVGKGFDSVLISSGNASITKSIGGIEKALPTISTSVGTAHIYVTPIFEALILPDGTIVAGAVDTARLVQVASTL